MNGQRLRRLGRRLGAWLVAAAVVAAAAGIVFVGTPFQGFADSVDAVESDPGVTVTQRGDTYVLEPASVKSATGIVFYPGARVHPDAYLATLAPLAREANVTVVVPKMPLNLAVFGQGTASRYVTDSDVDTWYVGGHSLGGAMACRYAHANPDTVEGLVLFGSYCDRDISGTDLAVLSVTGSADTVLNRDRYEEGLGYLPADATVREFPINHTQFGSYSGQPGDSPSAVSYDAAHEQLADVTLAWLRGQQ
ncbi:MULTISPECIES: alpha/beta hydrolase [Salinibaculum]|uniref:alpha/beta hydrolase n=1 Tax=Salinibaculum TaxID=2732368 RepID=UPI0030CA9E1D